MTSYDFLGPYNWLAGWVPNWLDGCMVGWLAGWLAVWLAGRLPEILYIKFTRKEQTSLIALGFTRSV